jgi:hypothetical protein
MHHNQKILITVLARFRRAIHEFYLFPATKIFVGAPVKPGQDEKKDKNVVALAAVE